MAELTDARRKSLLAYCRIDAAEADGSDLLRQCGSMPKDSAQGYMEQAGVSEPEVGTQRRAQYDLCVNYLVLDGWDRRDMTLDGSNVSENPAFRRMLNQLKLTEPVPESGT